MAEKRDNQGRFQKGNKAAAGHKNRVAKKRAELTEEFLKSVKIVHIKNISRKLVGQAEAGNLTAIKEILDRAMGKPQVYSEPDMPLSIEVTFPDELLT